MTKTPFFRTLGLAVALATLAGCGQGSLVSATTDMLNGAAALRAKGDAQAGQQQGKRGPEGAGMGMALYAALDLSAEQKAHIQAIAEKYKPQAPTEPAPAERPGAGFLALLTAEPLDVEALKAAIAARPAAPAKGEDHRLAMLVETRAVLSEAQIAQLVAQLEAGPTAMARPVPSVGSKPAERGEGQGPRRGEGGQRPDMTQRPGQGAPHEGEGFMRPSAPSEQRPDLMAELKLSAEQQAAFEAFKAKLEANKPAEPKQEAHEAQRAAMLTFWKTGDTAALEATKPQAVEPPAFPFDELVALATSLSVEQRVQLFSHGFGPRHEGPKGHEGPGGQRGHEGPRGERPTQAISASVEAETSL